MVAEPESENEKRMWGGVGPARLLAEQRSPNEHRG